MVKNVTPQQNKFPKAYIVSIIVTVALTVVFDTLFMWAGIKDNALPFAIMLTTVMTTVGTIGIISLTKEAARHG
jgi:hypothetical protein